MFNSSMSLKEQERIAYTTGNTELAFTLRQADDYEQSASKSEEAAKQLEEAISCIPDEDFLQEFITKLQNMSKSRVTKESVMELATELEEFQKEIAGNFEYMRDELKQASEALWNN